jgi:hypothetical protein
VVRISVVNAEIDENVFIAARADPGHPRVRIELAMDDFFVRQGRVGNSNEQAAFDAANRAPLAAEPFLLAGVNAIAKGGQAKGDALLTEARRRDPRFRVARLLLLNQYLIEGRTAEATAEMAALNHLISGAGDILYPWLAKMAADPTTSEALIPMLRREPQLQEGVLEQLVDTGASPDLIVRIASGGSALHDSSKPWQGKMLSRLVTAGDLDRALRLWRLMSGIADDGGAKGVYDGRFAGLAGPPPFNWELANGPIGAADRVRNTGLQVDFYGRQDGELASQLLMLRPGRYQLRFDAQGDAKGQASRLSWTISCQGSGAALLQLPVTGVTASSRLFAAPFTVPVGCPAQSLKLHGSSGDVASEQNLIVSDLSVTAEAAQ